MPFWERNLIAQLTVPCLAFFFVYSEGLVFGEGLAPPIAQAAPLPSDDLPALNSAPSGGIPFGDAPFGNALDNFDVLSPAPTNPAKDPDPSTDKTGFDHDSEPLSLPQIFLGTDGLPEPVRLTVELMLAASETGDLDLLRPIIDRQASSPFIGFAGDEVAESEQPNDPIARFAANSGDSEGHELLAILEEMLEAGYVHIDEGTEQELYLWPYFARYPLHRLTPAQRVDLFRLVTSYDLEQMQQFGAYNFFRLGISPDGTWQFLIAGD